MITTIKTEKESGAGTRFRQDGIIWEVLARHETRAGDYWCRAVEISERTGQWAYHAETIKRNAVTANADAKN